MAEKSLYAVQFNGKKIVVRAEGRNTVKADVLERIGFECKAATAEDVLAFANGGGKVVAIAGNATEDKE